jgi:hypothetical protein
VKIRRLDPLQSARNPPNPGPEALKRRKNDQIATIPSKKPASCQRQLFNMFKINDLTTFSPFHHGGDTFFDESD